MAYTPTNNPYIPGDPYSYDLDWIVGELKKKDTYKVEEAVTQAQTSASSAAESAAAAETSAQAAATSAADTTQVDAAAQYAAAAAQSAAAAAASAADTTQADAAESWSEESEAWAKGTKNGVAVGSSTAQYQNNAKYYAEQASQAANPLHEVANGSISNEYALLIVWIEDEAISGQQYTFVIPNDTTKTFDMSYNAWNSSFMYSMCALCQITNGTLIFTSLKGGGTNNATTDWSTMPRVIKIWGLKL